MQLRWLRVKNIRSYEAAEVAFAPGTTLLSGDVGAGKTSLLYAIEMALFGVAEVDAAYLVRHGSLHAEVEVGFEDAEHRYEIGRRFRRLRRKGRETFEPEKIRFKVDGEETTYSATELRQRVIELLGFPDNPNPQAHSDLWRWAVYVPQERMRDILGAKPQDRLETVRKALGVERYRTAADNAEELGTDLRRSAEGRRREAERLRHFDEEFAAGTAEGDRLRVERSALEASIARRTAAAEEARSAVTEALGTLRASDADARELESLTREAEADERAVLERTRVRADRVEEVGRRRKVVEEASAEASELEPLRKRLSSAESECAARRAELDRRAPALRELSEARAELTAARRWESETRANWERARTTQAEAKAQLTAALEEAPAHEPRTPTPHSVTELEERLEAAREREATTLRALTHAQAGLSELEELLSQGVCPRCHQPVLAAEFEPHRAESRAAVDAAETVHQKAVQERESVEQERRARERYERARERWVEVEKRRDLARRAVASAERDLRTVDASLREATSAVEPVRVRVERLEPEEALEAQLRRELTAAEAVRASLAEYVERSAGAAERMRAAANAIDALTEEVARIDHDIEGARARSAARSVRSEELRGALAGVEALRRAVADAETRLKSAEELRDGERHALVRLDTRLDEALRRVASAERGRAERAALVAEADDLARKAAWVSRPFRDALLQMEQKLLAHAQATFERNFGRYFASLIDDPALVARTDPTFTPVVMIEGEWTPAEALSGGERTSLALAFRLALAQVVRSLGDLRLETILLDEPTDGFSPEQVVRMGELLEELALPQVIIVSHETQLSAIADRVVRVQKQDGRSALVPVSALTGEAQNDDADAVGRRASLPRTAGRTVAR